MKFLTCISITGIEILGEFMGDRSIIMWVKVLSCGPYEVTVNYRYINDWWVTYYIGE